MFGREPVIDRRYLPTRAEGKMTQRNIVSLERAGDEAAAMDEEHGGPGPVLVGLIKAHQHRLGGRAVDPVLAHGYRRRLALHGDDLVQLHPITPQPSFLVGRHRLRFRGEFFEHGCSLRVEHVASCLGRNESGVPPFRSRSPTDERRKAEWTSV